MLIRSRLESKSQQRQKLSIDSSKSNSSKTNLRISTNVQSRNRSSFFKQADQKLRQKSQSKAIQDDKQFSSLQKENLSIKKQNSINKSEEKCSKHFILRPSQKHIKNQNMFINLPVIQNKTQKDQHPRLSMTSKRNVLNNRLVLSHLMGPSSTKGEEFKQTNDEEQNPDTRKISKGRRNAGNKKSNTVFIQNVENQLLEHADIINSQSINRISLYESIFTENTRPKRLSYESLNIKLSIHPHVKPQTRDIEVQAIQQQRDYFEYLKYKRRKEEYQNQLQNLFTEISIMKNDRATYKSRIQKLKSCQTEKPQNQREQRVFKIKDQIARQQKKVESIILQKFNSSQKYISQLGKLQNILSNDCEKFFQSFNTMFKRKTDDQKLNFGGNLDKDYEKMESFIRKIFRQGIKKIEMLIQRNKPLKQELLELVSAFDEYKNTICQQKNLLKNCFSHIKKIPQLCYGLCGNQLPITDAKTQFRNENNEFSMPKCLDCFNSEWKMHLIIEKNILMESIFKVTEQLLK